VPIRQKPLIIRGNRVIFLSEDTSFGIKNLNALLFSKQTTCEYL
jgi:hypothetical protein